VLERQEEYNKAIEKYKEAIRINKNELRAYGG
jgi:hypothetical protein